MTWFVLRQLAQCHGTEKRGRHPAASTRARRLPKIDFAGFGKAALAFRGAELLGEGLAAMVSKDFEAQLKGYGLTTAEIHYHMPTIPP